MSEHVPVPHLGSPILVDDVQALRAEVGKLTQRVMDLEGKAEALQSLVVDQHTPILSNHDRRIGAMETGMATLLRDVARTLAGIVRIESWEKHFLDVAEVKRRLDFGPDPDATPNQRGGG